jgi:hypothetical protein
VRIAALFGIERTICGHATEQRRAVRLAQTRPLIDDLRAWLEAKLAKVSGGFRIAQAIRYALKHWAGLTVFLDDGRVEIDSTVVERSIRPIALNRKNALFAGSDQGGVDWGVIPMICFCIRWPLVNPESIRRRFYASVRGRHAAANIMGCGNRSGSKLFGVLARAATSDHTNSLGPRPASDASFRWSARGAMPPRSPSGNPRRRSTCDGGSRPSCGRERPSPVEIPGA